ncbi:MAG: hypothetical protein ACLFQK_01890 [Fibrobacterota bacterium]
MKLKPAKTALNDKIISELYRLLSVPMIDFDCGSLCAPQNGGVPECCDMDITVPVLYLDEYRWQQNKGSYWKPMPVETDEDFELADGIDEECCVLAVCPGPASCLRKRRAFVCRTFPFDPYLDKSGAVKGLVFQYKMSDRCPLVGRPRKIFNDLYIRNSIMFWEKIFECLPEEKELYRKESIKLRRSFGARRKKIKIFN